ncbi:hypothetical protein FBU30_000109 [Linnemannia zychae]|nr:hypothetical protein FBU30_000109 [Linnemannia zychae]
MTYHMFMFGHNQVAHKEVYADPSKFPHDAIIQAADDHTLSKEAFTANAAAEADALLIAKGLNASEREKGMAEAKELAESFYDANH